MMTQYWIWLGSFVIFKGIQTSIAKKPFIFVIFQGGPDTLSPPPPLDPHMSNEARFPNFGQSLHLHQCFV